MLRRSALRIACLLLALGWGATAQAQLTGTYPVTGGGGQLAVGNGLQLPIQFVTPPPAGTMFPPLLVPVAGGATVMQTGAADPLTIMAAPGVLAKAASMATIGVFLANPGVLQVATSLNFTWPLGGATLAPGGRTGLPVTVVPGAAGNSLTYTATGAKFGGPGAFKLTAGPGSVGGAVPGSPVSVFIGFGIPPGIVTMAALAPAFPSLGMTTVGGAPITGPAPGLPLGAVITTPGATPTPGMATFAAAAVTPMGFIMPSASGIAVAAPAGINNAATSTGGPWTTGMLTIAAPGAVPPEGPFVLSGMDTRLSGVGNISLVSGAMSLRTTGPNANRGWLSLTLPEPTAMVGAGAALAALLGCHALVRRRSR